MVNFISRKENGAAKISITEIKDIQNHISENFQFDFNIVRPKLKKETGPIPELLPTLEAPGTKMVHPSP